MTIAFHSRSVGQNEPVDSSEALKPVYSFDPISDERWNDFLWSHPRSSIFHTRGWLSALRDTYGYQPFGFTTSPPGAKLRNSVVFCQLDSWLTGRRLVSLPFSDHCAALVDSEQDLKSIGSGLANERQRLKLDYIELRLTDPSVTLPSVYRGDVSYCLHRLDLRPSLDALFQNLHKDSTQRKIRRAEREGLTYQEGRSGFLLETFNRLWLQTRRRHLAPPQPANWFHNLIACLGEALKIRVAFKDGQSIAAILTLKYKDTLVYKYGCSDAHFHSLGGMHLLLWKSIQEAKQDGLRLFDLGRSDWGNSGLLTFKDRWGASRSTLEYSRIGRAISSSVAHSSHQTNWRERVVRSIFRHAPDRVFSSLGTLFYRHIG